MTWDQVVERQCVEALAAQASLSAFSPWGLMEHPDGLRLAFVGSLASGLRPSLGSI